MALTTSSGSSRWTKCPLERLLSGAVSLGQRQRDRFPVTAPRLHRGRAGTAEGVMQGGEVGRRPSQATAPAACVANQLRAISSIEPGCFGRADASTALIKLSYVDHWPPGVTTAGMCPSSCHRRSVSGDLPRRLAASGNGTRQSRGAGAGLRRLAGGAAALAVTVMLAFPRGIAGDSGSFPDAKLT